MRSAFLEREAVVGPEIVDLPELAWCYADSLASTQGLAMAGLRLERRYEDTEAKSGQHTTCLQYSIRREDLHTAS